MFVSAQSDPPPHPNPPIRASSSLECALIPQPTTRERANTHTKMIHSGVTPPYSHTAEEWLANCRFSPHEMTRTVFLKLQVHRR
jgi:hypothetical protein